MVFYAPIMGIGGVIRALDKAASMWWVVGIAVLVLIGLISVVFAVALPKFKIVQKLIDRLNLVSRESLSGMMVIRAFNMQKYEENRFEKANSDLTSVSLFINRVMVIMMPLMMLIMNGLTLAIIWFGSHEVSDGTMQVGDMIAFLQYAMQIVMAFLMLTMMFIILPRASVSVERIKEVLNTEPLIRDSPNPKQFSSSFEGKIEFRDVSFRYPNAAENVLNNISFTAYPGQMTAFIGATGSGKSTVVHLIPRFYEVTDALHEDLYKPNALAGDLTNLLYELTGIVIGNTIRLIVEGFGKEPGCFLLLEGINPVKLMALLEQQNISPVQSVLGTL